MSIGVMTEPIHWHDRIRSMLLGKSTDSQLQRRSSCLSVTGRREENQDRCMCDDRDAIYMIADGMGGYRGGSIASEIAIETIPSVIKWSLPSGDVSEEELQVALESALEEAKRKMKAAARVQPECSRMGCTLALAVVLGGDLFYTNIGDSRVYLLHDSHLKRLTTDESLVQELYEAGAISEKEMEHHRWRHIVTNSLSVDGYKKTPHWHHLSLHRDDELLVTSDGLTDFVSDAEIAREMRQCKSPGQCTQRLIDDAMANDSTDNISCVTAYFEDESCG